MSENFHITDRLIELVKEFEGYRSKAYLDAAGIWTIGYGRTGRIKEGETTDREYEDNWLRWELTRVGRIIESAVKVPMATGQFEALASLVYNIGTGAFHRSTLLKRFNDCDHKAYEEFDKWIHAGGKVLPGLVRRRKREQELFNEHLEGIRVMN